MMIVIMGVSGSGKSTIGQKLSEKLGFQFFDGDSFHPEENIEKMSVGVPLSDKDRYPWLQQIRKKMIQLDVQGKSGVFAISALKEDYRAFLSTSPLSIYWVYLKGDFKTIYRRMEGRVGHFMSANMLKSQFSDLEEPHSAITISIDQSPEKAVNEIVEKIGRELQ